MSYKSFKNSYEGWVTPKQGATPFEVIDDPAIIKKKNEMRAALSEEYNKRWLNPYRQAAGIGGTPFDPMVIRYNAMIRTQQQFFRCGPRFVSLSWAIMFGPYLTIVYLEERHKRNQEYCYRTGQVAYKDHPLRKMPC